MVGVPRTAHSTSVHTSVATAVARTVLMYTWPANALDSRLEPTLKPNQPTQSSEAPIITSGRLCGAMALVP